MNNAMKILGYIVVTAMLSILNGIVLADLWLWFVVPIFHLPILQTVQAMGLALIVSYTTH